MRKYALVIAILLVSVSWGNSQRPTLQRGDTLLRMGRDTIPMRDSMPTLKPVKRNYKLSKDSIQSKVVYGSLDSQHLDIRNRIHHLYGDAFVNYENLQLKADYIQFDFVNNVAIAQGFPDSTGELAGFPVFINGEQTFGAYKLTYDFKERRGLINDVSTTQGDIQLLGTTTTFLGKGEGREDDVIYNRGAIFTTCDAPEPHFGIRSRKQKVVPNKVAVVGLSNLEIAGVPTPLILPFGFIPLKKGQRAGLMFPRDYEYSPRWGFGLRNVGYYFPINDYLDATLLTDIYFRGSFGVQGEFRYRKRYKYNGRLNIAYSRFVEEMDNGRELFDVVDKSFRFQLTHNQDPKAHPSITVGGSINIQTNNYQQLNNNDYESVIGNQQLSSNFNIRHSLPGTPFRMSMSLTHSQNINTGRVNLSLPKFDVQMNRIYPFERKNAPGPEKWYEKISLNYNGTVQNRINAQDTALFDKETWQNAQFGVRQNIETDYTGRVFKYFNFSPFIRLRETWYTKGVQRTFVEDLVIEADTIFNADSSAFEVVFDTLSYGEVMEFNDQGFKAIHEYTTGISVNTQVFGTVQFKKGWLRGFRHTLKPSFSLSYTPDYTRDQLGYYEELEIINNDGERETQLYSPYSGQVFGAPSSGGQSLALSYGFTNIFEAKFFNKKDSTEKKLKLFDNIRVSGNYNFAADSLNFSTMNISGNTRLFKGVTTLSIQAVYDFYAVNDDNRRIDQFYAKAEGKPLRFVRATLRLATGFSVADLRGWFGKDDGSGEKKRRTRPQGLFEGGLIEIFDNVRVSHNLTVTRQSLADGSRTTDITANSISLRGRIPLSAKWNFNISRLDYNFITKQFTYPDLGISRDLHCWEMGINWQAARGTYNFYLRVKPGSLDFLKVPYRKNRSDAFAEFN